MVVDWRAVLKSVVFPIVITGRPCPSVQGKGAVLPIHTHTLRMKASQECSLNWGGVTPKCCFTLPSALPGKSLKQKYLCCRAIKNSTPAQTKSIQCGGGGGNPSQMDDEMPHVDNDIVTNSDIGWIFFPTCTPTVILEVDRSC